MTARQGPGVVATTLVVLVCQGILSSLGVWQLHRKVWKENLIAAMTTRLDAPPEPLPPSSQWGKLSQAEDEFRRVTFDAQFVPGRDALVYTPGSALRSDIKGPGYFVFAPARLADGSVIVVDRGFIPADRKDAPAPNGSAASEPLQVTGVLRWPEERSVFTPASDSKSNVWFLRDPNAMSEQNRWGATAPFYVDQEGPVPPGGLPKPGKLEVRLRDDHLQYAITWFGLAAGLIGVYGWWLVGRVRARRA
jgi:cytochrome oxidase assembly protein ShyY1